MTNNLTPWIVLGVLVVLSLAYKGYFKLPSLQRSQPPAPPVAVDNRPTLNELARAYLDPSTMTSHELAVLMANAARREAEQEVASQIADEAAKKLKATFASPFSGPAPVAQEPKAGE